MHYNVEDAIYMTTKNWAFKEGIAFCVPKCQLFSMSNWREIEEIGKVF